MSSNEQNILAMPEESIANLLETEKKEPHPLDEATYRFKTSFARIKYLNGVLSKKSLGRVYTATVGFPLSDKPPKFKGLEQELFMLTLTALSAKEYIMDFVISNKQELLKQEELLKKVNEAKVEERIEESYVK